MRLLRPLAVGLLVSGCSLTAASGGDVPATPRALAYVAAEHTDEPSSGTAHDVDPPLVTALSADLRYGATGESDGDLLQVSVLRGPRPPELRCGSAPGDGCEETDRGTLLWQLEEPEEDPGVVSVVVVKGDVHVRVYTSGPHITGDPREQDLPIPVETLFDIAHDPRVDTTTTQEAVDADPPWWDPR